MSLNFCKRDIKSIRCDYCRQMTTQWISICDHHQPLTSSESISETDGLSEDSGLGEITYANSFHMQKNNWCFRSRVNYLLFGTYLFYCQPIEITDPFFYFAYISPNSSLIGKTYHMRISFEDIKELLHCSILGNFLLFIELKRSTSLFIERSMNLNGGGRKGLRFDVDSDGKYHSAFNSIKPENIDIQ